MREYLFRGRVPMKSKPVWKEGYVVPLGESVNIFDDLLGKGYGVEPETVSEYIQRTDKHGKKVFEGDVIRVPLVEGEGYEYFVVEYVDDTYFFGFILREFLNMGTGTMFSQKFFSERCEVIGNRWDMTTDDLVKLGLIKSGVRHG